ncbi:MAG: circularly permuted type 2 ATP-grasp protein [Granulosicoccus sp.]
MKQRWNDYSSPGYDELIDSNGQSRTEARALTQWFNQLSDEELAAREQAARLAIQQMGITFTVYSDKGNIDREWPLDIVPRIISAQEWGIVEKGLKQRLKALNMFINDIYNDQKVLKDGIVPRALIESSSNFRKECIGMQPPHNVWAHICGSDLVRGADGTVYVLEDNLRVPSGVSYMIENREVMKRTMPEVFRQTPILPVDNYTANLRDMLCTLSDKSDPSLCVLTPGVFNSAYFEHTFLAQEIGAELVEGRDLIVDDDGYVYMLTVSGKQRVDVIYRRVDDAFIDPACFNPESTLGVAGLMQAWRENKVAIANAPGAGVADDKVIYSYVTDIIRYYLDSEPLIQNVPTYRCETDKDREYVLDNLASLVVKPANESGGYGMLIGPNSSAEERAAMEKNIRDNPRNYIGQPTLTLSTAPTLHNGKPSARHVDLRPFVLQGESLTVTTGGLTRVAMVEGSLVVNSSQGGGSKDTWVVDGSRLGAEASTHSQTSMHQSQSSQAQDTPNRARGR